MSDHHLKKNDNGAKGEPYVCPHKFAFMLSNPLRMLFQSPAKIAGEYIREGDTVIDLGCGPGFFAVRFAAMVGERGRVIAVDLQPEMLALAQKKAAKAGVAERMTFHRCAPDRVGLEQLPQADFMMAFYMAHETPDIPAFLAEVRGYLKPGGKFLIVEPKMHVDAQSFAHTIRAAETAGFRTISQPAKKSGRALLLTR